jgi:hypothetical protein
VVTACMWQATRYDKGSPVGLISLTDFPFFWEGSVSYQVVYELRSPPNLLSPSMMFYDRSSKIEYCYVFGAR